MSNTLLPKSLPYLQHKSYPSRRKLYAAMLVASQWMAAGHLHAAPEGGEVVAGEGTITQTGVDTLIQQASDRMAIDWRSFDVAANERVEFIQPSSSSIALNRVLSNNGSKILGRIDANGQVMLVNANGVVFGKDSVINVGGMIASGMSIDPESFINGDFTLNSIEGTEGKVINYGIINAATGGSVTLVGQQVQNDGLISAKLGAVNLAAGNEAVLTFDQSGLVGVKVTEAVLQNELGVDAAVINNGDIIAEGGRVLLSASVSEDIFSNAVNNAGMNKASSVVVHDDGSFTLGAGADVINTGDIDTSVATGAAGQVVVVGNNITSSGTITANTNSGTAGAIELHSTDTTLVTETGNVSAQAAAQGEGGDIKILGNKVGLFDSAEINASGANGGGQVLIGGDKTGDNQKIRNADFIYLGENTAVKTDALINGNGGKLITFASDTARIYGNLYSRGGSEGGNGGFIETSGLKGFEILNTPDITAAAGTGGTWLIDPYDIVIDSDNSTSIITSNSGKTFTSNNTATLSIDILRDSLTNGSTVIVQTGGSASDGDNSDTDMGNITLDKGLNFNFSDNATLRLLAHNNIILNENIQRKNDNVTGTLNLELIANKDDLDGGDITVASGKTIATNGGYFYAGVRPAVDTEDTDGFLNSDIDSPTLGTFTSTGATIDTTGDLGGGDIVINATNNVTLGLVAFGYNYLNANFGGTNPDKAELIRVGSLTIDSKADVTLNDAIDFNNTGKRTNAGGKGYSGNLLDGEETFLRIDAFGNIEIKGLISDADYGDARDALNIDLTAGKNNTSGGDIKIEADIYTAGGNFTATSTTFTSTGRLINTERANASLVDITTNTNGNGQPNGNAQWSNGGNVTINAGTNIALGDITTDGSCLAPSVCTGILSLAVTDIVLDPDQQPNVVITQAPGSVLKIAGDATFNAGTNGDIKLTNDNIFNGNLLFTSARDVELTGITALTQPTDTTAVTFGKSQINRNLTLTSGGGVTQVNDLYVGGETKLTFTGADKSINLSTHVNDFVGKISLTNNVSHLLLSDINNLSLDAVTLVAGADASIGNIELTSGDAYSIILNGNLNSANGTTKNITLNSNVTLASDVELNAGTGNILFSGTINSNDNTTPRNLTVTGSKSFISGDITTAGGDVKITASDSISVNSIDTSADTAGLIALTVNGSDAARSITVNGDLNAQNTVVGQKSVDLTLASDSAGGSVKLNFTPTSNSYLSSDISVNGSAGLGQTLTAVNANNTWNLTAENAGTIEKTGSTSKIITFIGFENINGGEQVDTFNITDNISTSVNGGSGDDVFNINVTTIDALLNGDAGADAFNIVTTDAVTAILNGGGDTDTLVSAAAGANNWMLGATESLNSSIDFSDIENLTGNNDVDTFRFNGIRASTGVINASGSEDIVEVLSDAEIDFSGVFSFFGITNAEVLESINGGILRTLSNELDVIQWTFNATANSVTDGTNLVKFTGFTSYIGGEGDDNFSVENNITFAGLVDGSDGNNIFDFSDATEAYSIVLSSAYQTDSSATLSNFSEIKANSHTGTSLEAIAGTNFWEVTAKDSGKVGNTTFTGVSTIIGASPSDSISTSINGHANWSIKATDPSTLSDSNDPQNVLISFSNIGKLVGSIYNDTFAFETGASIVSAEGGAGSGTDTADFSELAARTITIGAATEFSFTGVERFKADVLKAFVLTASSGATWTIDNSGGEIDGTVGNIEFVGFKTLQGSNANDTFNLITNFGGVINAEGGDDTFEIRNGYTGELQGGNGVDTFAFFDGGSIGTDGIVNAGDGLDQVDLRALSTGVTVVASNSMVYGVANVERVIADSNKGFTLTAGGTDNAWHIYDFDGSGTVANGANDGVVAGIQFVDFSTLTGGALVDTFTIDSNFTGTISGGDGADIFNINAVVTNISGGIGNDSFVFFNTGSVTTASGDDGNDIVDFRNINASHTVTLDGTRINNVDSISRVIANNAFDFTLAANAGSNTWRIYDFDGAGSASDGVNDGELAGIQFIDFKNLQGGSGVDTFDIDTNFTGTISGGSGADIFNIKAAATNITGGADDDSFVFYSAGSVTTASGNDGNDIVDFRNIAANRTVTLSGTSINNVASVSRVIANSAFDFTLAATSGTNSWRVYDFDGAGNASDGVNDGEVAGIQFVDFKNLQGGLGVDSFDIDTNFSGTISGGDGADIFNINAVVTSISGGIGNDSFVFFNTGSVTTASGDDGNDIVDFRNINASHTVTLDGTRINNVDSISRVIANNAFDFTLAANAGSNTWHIYDFDGAGSNADGVNDGEVAGIQFIDFKNLQGGSGVDSFDIDTNFTGTISGGDGADIFNINAVVTNIAGGIGNDSFVFFNTGSVTTASGGDGNDIVDFRNINANHTVTLDGTRINNVASISRVIANNAFDFTLAANAGTNTWRIYDFDGAGSNADGINDGEVAGIQFIDFKNLQGGLDNDIFIIDTAFNGIISGRGGADVFNINALVNNISGGDDSDSFVFFNTGSVTTATGGAGDDFLDFRNINASHTVTLDGTRINNVDSISRVIANNAFDFTLVANAGSNTWHIYDFDGAGSASDGVNDGEVAGIQFVDFKNLQGGSGVDRFDIDTNFTGAISGGGDADIFNINALVNNISGGIGNDSFVFFNTGSVTTASGGDGNDIVDFRNINANHTVTLDGTRINNVDSISRVIANNTFDFTLAANAGNNTWRIYDFDGAGSNADGINDGEVAGIQFIDFKNLQGGSGVDRFDIDTNFTGTISGGGDADIFNINAFVNTIFGDNGNDSFIVGNSGSVTVVSGGLGTNNTLTGRNSQNTWALTTANVGSVSTGSTVYIDNFSGIQILQGGDSSDTFNLAFTFSGTVNGGAGADIFNIDAAANILQGEGGNDSFLFNSTSNVGSANQIDGGNPGEDNQITGRETLNTWTITSTNAGNVKVTSGATYIANFSNIQTLNGGAAADEFFVNADLTGTIQSGAGKNIFHINTSVGQLQGGTDDDEFIFGMAGSAQSVNGNGGINTLRGRDVANTWNYTGTNAGNLSQTDNFATYVNNFSNIQTLQGGSNVDIFNINAAAGNIFGNAGNDRFVFSSNNNVGSAVSIDGGTDSNYLIGRNAANSWTMLGANNGSLSITNGNIYVENFSAINNLEGGNVSDRLFGVNQNNDWKITGIDRGNLQVSASASSVAFTNIENLVGNQEIDTFTFTTNQSYITGLIDGGSSATLTTTEDSIDLSALTSGVTVELGNSESNNLNLVNIESITAFSGNPNSNVIIGASENAYRWNITSANAGLIELSTSPSFETRVEFNNFGDLRGGTNSDRFNVQAPVSKSISGGDGGGIDLVDYSNRTENFTITIGGNGSLGNTGINGIEGVIGNSSKDNVYNSTINVTDGNNTWTIGAFDTVADGLNDGTININGKIISFENFNSLIGGSGNDTFNYSSQGQLLGLIDGGAGNNTINASQSAVTQQFHINGNGAGVTNLVRIEELTGNSATNSTLVSTSSANTWNVNNQGIGRLNNSLRFAGISSLTGGLYTDVFNIENISFLTGIIDGGSGSSADQLNLTGVNTDLSVGIGATAVANLRVSNIESINANSNRTNTFITNNLIDNSWLITGLNSGTLNTTLSFSGFANLVGRETADTFIFDNELSNISGWIDAGVGIDTLDLTQSNRDVVVHIAADNAVGNNGEITVNNFEAIAADADNSNKLIAKDVDNMWTITSINGGQLNETVSNAATVFTNFKHLTGGSQNDIFNFESAGNITGLIDGAAHRDQDIVDVSKSINANIVITAAGANSGYGNIEKFIGNNTTSTIAGDNRVNNWVVNNNAGTINRTIQFEGFANIVGGNSQDIFSLNNAVLAGYIDGSEGNDTFNLTQSAINGGIRGGTGDDLFNITVVNGFASTVDIIGGQGLDRLFVSGGDVNYKATHQQGVLQYASPTNLTYTVNYSDITDITDNVIADSLTLWGTSSNDVFTLQNSNYWLTPETSITYLQKQNLTINGSSSDQIKIDGSVSIPKTFTVNNASLISENAGKIIAQSLELVATQNIGSEAERLKLAVDDIYLKSTNGNLYLDEQDSLNIKEFSASTTNIFDVILGGDLSSSANINYAGQFNVNSLYGNIVLNNNNSFAGNLALNATGNIAVKNNTSLNLSYVQAQNLTIDADGTVTSEGPMIVNGLTSISSSADLSLLHVDNDLNSLTIIKANNISINEKNNLTLTGISANGNVTINAKNSINVSDSCSDNCGDNSGISAKNVTINSDSGDITVGKRIFATESIDFDADGITVNDSLSAKDINLNAGAGNLLLNESGHLNAQLGNSIDLAGNRIEQRSTISSTGDIRFAASNEIQMINGSLTESASGNVTYTGNNIALATIKAVNGEVNLSADGAITDNNDDNINIYANRWSADAATGIGSGRFGAAGQDAIETDVNILSVRNAGKLLGDTKINILNSGSLTIEQLRNNGDISIANLTGDFILDNTHNGPFDINKTDAREQGGVINAGTNGGVLTLSIPNGMVRAENDAVKSNPDIIADIATFDYSPGTRFGFGDRNRKIVMHIPSVYKQTAKTSSIIWHIRKPFEIVDSSTPLKNLASNDQLIQIEGLSEIDPAIFTSVRNYLHDEVAILMPADQRFDEDEYAE